MGREIMNDKKRMKEKRMKDKIINADTSDIIDSDTSNSFSDNSNNSNNSNTFSNTSSNTFNTSEISSMLSSSSSSSSKSKSDTSSNTSDSSSSDEEEYGRLITLNEKYPEQDDPDIQYKIYKKREFYAHKAPSRPDKSTYAAIKEYRSKNCPRDTLYPHQALLSNLINPDTPYRGMLIFHGLGSGKTFVGIAIAEGFKQMVQKHGTKIHILTPGPLIKENWKNTLCNHFYMTKQNNNTYLSDADKNAQKRDAMLQVMQYYTFLTFKGFYKRVLGEKITDKKEVVGNKVKTTYKKNIEGEFERDFSMNRIHNLNNTIIIVDEAHALTDNSYGDALQYIIKRSINLKVVLCTATPMKNFADDIIPLLNFIRPPTNPIEREKIFDSNKNFKMDLKQNGMQYFKKMASGYVSHVKGGDPLIFAKKVEMGITPKKFLFTKITRCKMMEFQKVVYDIKSAELGTLLDEIEERKSEAVANFAKSEAIANFVFPVLSPDKKKVIGSYGKEAIDLIKEQIKNDSDRLNNTIADAFKKNGITFGSNDIINLSSEKKIISGDIMKFNNLKHFSTKFYRALRNINKLYYGKKGPSLAFIYSNLVKVGIEVFEQVLLQNGYLEYNDERQYNIKGSTKCYFCGKSYESHDNTTKNIYENDWIDDPDTDLDIEELKFNKVEMQTHQFYPATYVSITGKGDTDSNEYIPEEKKRILDDVFNNISNASGKHIKLVLGSKVMNEGLSLFNVKEVHILDVHFNLAKVDQVIGRAVRVCSHINLANENNVYPEVNIYKYAISENSDTKLSSEEEMYRKAELKYLLIKKIERAMKEVAIDCPLNINNNIYEEDVEANKGCTPIENLESKKKGHILCSQDCDFGECYYKCENKKLNLEFYDPDRKMYKNVSKNQLDNSTYTHKLSQTEIQYVKKIIKNMYLNKFEYTLKDIADHVKKEYATQDEDLYDDFFVYKALDDLIPIHENDYNNLNDLVLDKYNRQGYIIYIDGYYVFQPIDQNEDVPMYYRTTYNKNITNHVTLRNFLKKENILNNANVDIDNEINSIDDGVTNDKYSFASNDDYYENRDEYDYVGIIDKEVNRKSIKDSNELKDVFKIRDKRLKILDKKRGTGIPSFKGAVCITKDKPYIYKLAKKLGIDITQKNGDSRFSLCDELRDHMLLLEKYSTGEKKKTYVMVPTNHKVYRFPYNIEDYSMFLEKKIYEEFGKNVQIKKEIVEKTSGSEKGYPSIILTITSIEYNSLKDEKKKSFLEKYNCVVKNNKCTFIID